MPSQITLTFSVSKEVFSMINNYARMNYRSRASVVKQSVAEFIIREDLERYADGSNLMKKLEKQSKPGSR